MSVKVVVTRMKENLFSGVNRAVFNSLNQQQFLYSQLEGWKCSCTGARLMMMAENFASR